MERPNLQKLDGRCDLEPEATGARTALPASPAVGAAVCADTAVRAPTTSLRYTIYVLLFLIITFRMLASAAAADMPNPDQAFEQANRLYEQANYAEAIVTYDKILNTGYVSAAVHFNLANAHFKSGKLGLAIAHYRLAESLDPRDPAIRANLQFVRNAVSGGPASPSSLARRLLSRLTLDEWTWLAGGLVWIWFLLLTLRQVRPSLAPRLTRVCTLAGLLAVLTGSALAIAWNTHARAPHAVVILPDTAARFGPFDESQKAFDLRDGVELVVLDRQNDWFYVTDAAKHTGWVKRDQVFLLGKRPPTP